MISEWFIRIVPPRDWGHFCLAKSNQKRVLGGRPGKILQFGCMDAPAARTGRYTLSQNAKSLKNRVINAATHAAFAPVDAIDGQDFKALSAYRANKVLH